LKLAYKATNRIINNILFILLAAKVIAVKNVRVEHIIPSLQSGYIETSHLSYRCGKLLIEDRREEIAYLLLLNSCEVDHQVSIPVLEITP
jgi:hypothetical protein